MKLLRDLGAEQRYLSPKAIGAIGQCCGVMPLAAHRKLLDESLLVAVDAYYQFAHMNADIDAAGTLRELETTIGQLQDANIVTTAQATALRNRIKYNQRRYRDPVVLLAGILGEQISILRDEVISNEAIDNVVAAVPSALKPDVVLFMLRSSGALDYFPETFTAFFK